MIKEDTDACSRSETSAQARIIVKFPYTPYNHRVPIRCSQKIDKNILHSDPVSLYKKAMSRKCSGFRHARTGQLRSRGRPLLPPLQVRSVVVLRLRLLSPGNDADFLADASAMGLNASKALCCSSHPTFLRCFLATFPLQTVFSPVEGPAHLNALKNHQIVFCRFFLQEIVIESPPGHAIGFVRQDPSCCAPKWTVYREDQETPLIKIVGPACQGCSCFSDIEFQVSGAGERAEGLWATTTTTSTSCPQQRHHHHHHLARTSNLNYQLH